MRISKKALVLRMRIVSMKFRTFVKLCLAVVSITLGTACATVEGVGKDVERVGEAVQDAAND